MTKLVPLAYTTEPWFATKLSFISANLVLKTVSLLPLGLKKLVFAIDLVAGP